MKLSSIFNRIKYAISLVNPSFLIRQYVIALLIAGAFLWFGFTQTYVSSPILIISFFIVNVLLFPFSKYLVVKLKQWFFDIIIQGEPAYDTIGCLGWIFKFFKNLVLFFFSYALGWFGLLILVISSFKSEVK